MFARFLDTSSVDAFATWVVGELKRARPPERVDDESKRAIKQREEFESVLRRRAANLVSTTRLNIYQKAKLGTRLQEALESAGYSVSFSRQFAHDVARMVAIASSQSR